MKASAVLSTLYPAIVAAMAATCEKDAGPCIMANDCCKGYTCKTIPGSGSRPRSAVAILRVLEFLARSESA
ncbi:hypothetical protein FBULB1_3423 [Fusarium bulbicola]|nr:hypothetical protein FBULB1_3423 [Fusarium bulbicola]